MASAGLAIIGIGACGGATSGNLLPPRCPDGGTDLTKCDTSSATDAGTTDAGTTDAGKPDGGP